jgi:hypothetical protein
MYFYTAAVVEGHWKECLEDMGGLVAIPWRICPGALVNNYKAWLYDEKTHQANL